MSYVRWGSIINSPFSLEETYHMTKNKITLKEQEALAKEQNNNAELSDWYIFWHVSEDNIKENQLLATWHNTLSDLPTLTYAELKKMQDTDDWSYYDQYESITQMHILKFYVSQFLKDCDKKL